ncbi:MAG TPA: hypothetical protein VFV01_12470 [Spirillospora sp.]|nr:hypothetical protein [Spirillospora sp.]
MTDPPVPPGTPHELLSSVHDLTRRVRRAQRGAWFPLLLLGALTLAAIPVDRYGHYATTCANTRGPGGASRVCTISSTWSFAYWAVALVVAYAVITGFYVHRSRARGVGTPVRPYALAGIGLAVLVTGAALWISHRPMSAEHDVLGLHLQPGSGAVAFLYRLAGPAAAIGLSLLVLAWIERNPALLAFTAGYLAIVLVPVTFGWTVRSSPWSFLPHLVVPGAVLLAGGAAFALARPVVKLPRP